MLMGITLSPSSVGRPATETRRNLIGHRPVQICWRSADVRAAKAAMAHPCDHSAVSDRISAQLKLRPYSFWGASSLAITCKTDTFAASKFHSRHKIGRAHV